MNHDYKSHYLMGFKDGLVYGVEKGMELAESWGSESEGCPPANTEPMLVESIPSTPEEM